MKRASRSRSDSPSVNLNTSPFRPEVFRFLEALEQNNRREWFQEYQSKYESDVREPALNFIREMGGKLPKISKQFVVSDKKVGGSLMRIHRDVRFSADKTPYKTNVGIQFRHVAGKDVHAPGFYLHIDPDEAFVGVGIWHPDAEALAQIRRFIVAKPKIWERSIRDPSFCNIFQLTGDALKRPPKGFDAEHPLIEELKRKDHIAVAKLTKKQVVAKGFVDRVYDMMASSRPYMRSLCKALELNF